MTEQESLARMVPPGARRPGKYREGVIQIHITRACDKACYNCTQGSNYGGKTYFMPVDLFEEAVKSVEDYWGVVGVFGGNPALHPKFGEICEVLRNRINYEQRGLWCNNPNGWGPEMARTFNPAVSNLNVHLDQKAFLEFKRDWPNSSPFGLYDDSRHSPVYVAMKDVLRRPCERCHGTGHEPYNNPHTGLVEYGQNALCQNCDDCLGFGTVYDEARAWELISNCDINQHWSAMVGMFRGQLRAWFCEVAGAQSILYQDDPSYPDTGMFLYPMGKEFGPWWRQPMQSFADQVRKHCHECGVPLRGKGELAQAPDEAGTEQVSQTHESLKPKRKGRRVELVTVQEQLGSVSRTTDYLGNAKRVK